MKSKIWLLLGSLILMSGVCLYCLTSQSILLALFSLEVIFFGIFMTLLEEANFLGVYFILMLIVLSGVLGLCLFVGSISEFSQETSQSFLE